MVDVEDRCWHGYLANLSPDEFTRTYLPELPETMEGKAFLARYGGTTDRVTHIESARTYAVRGPTSHPVFETCACASIRGAARSAR